ncbi:zinc finger protein 283 isoform X20 [Manduca sexta]|uniref:zinc finger protein 283 isoform X20 n=1 Tax=Manduca sexta TaxID=7130 RepID=UPI00188EF75C|nr:zinc finger protein 283 isoform X20 [Manduca sexta]
MDGKTSDWRPGPSVCRCCLAEGCYKDISTEYFWMGKREVYADMLSDTFSVSIAYSSAGGPNSHSRLICEPCISRLRDAADFKRQVQECERTFMQHLDPGSTSAANDIDIEAQPAGKEVKLEQVKLEKRFSDDDFDTADFGDEDDDDMDDQPLTKFATKVPKKEAVDFLDLIDNSQITVKRMSMSKSKAPPAKKVKVTKKEPAKPTASKAPIKVVKEKKKKGERRLTTDENIKIETNTVPLRKEKYKRSARAEARIITKKNAAAILECWTMCPFRWKKNRFKCAYCEENFTDSESLRAHVKLCGTQHTIKDIYSKFKEMPLINIDVVGSVCVFCSAPYTDIKQMRDHVIQHGFDFESNHPDGVLPFYLDKEWKCVICKQQFNNFLKLYEHMNIHYQHYICATCGKGYMTAPRLRKHSEVHISGSFPCNECGKIFTMRVARDSHKATAHAKGPRYECPHCSMRFKGYYDRMEHLKEAHRQSEVSYRCVHCDLSFKTSGKRAAHVSSVHFPPEYDFVCIYCERLFKTSYDLKRHMVRHSGEKNFHCQICRKAFCRKRALVTHLKSHEE